MPMKMGEAVAAWSEAGMRKYDELYAMIKNDSRKKSAPTFNQQELLEMSSLTTEE